MIFVAEGANYWLNYGKDYAAGLGATIDPRIAAAQKRLASMKTGGQVQDETTALYQPAVGAAGRLGEDVNRVGMSGLSALGGLGASLPGFNPNMLADAARSTSRAGGSAALMGGVLGTNVQQNLATSIMANQQNLEGQRFLNEDKVVAAGEEKARLLADYLQYAQGGQGIETGSIGNINTEAQTAQTIATTPTYDSAGNPTNEAARTVVSNRANTEASTASSMAQTGLVTSQTPTYDSAGNPTNAAAIEQGGKIAATTASTANITADTAAKIAGTPEYAPDKNGKPGKPLNAAARREQAELNTIRKNNKLTVRQIKALDENAQIDKINALVNVSKLDKTSSKLKNLLLSLGFKEEVITKAFT